MQFLKSFKKPVVVIVRKFLGTRQISIHIWA